MQEWLKTSLPFLGFLSQKALPSPVFGAAGAERAPSWRLIHEQGMLISAWGTSGFKGREATNIPNKLALGAWRPFWLAGLAVKMTPFGRGGAPTSLFAEKGLWVLATAGDGVRASGSLR